MVNKKKAYIEILFESGAVLEFNASALTTKRNPLSGELTSIEWEEASNAPQHVNLSHIDSIRFVQP